MKKILLLCCLSGALQQAGAQYYYDWAKNAGGKLSDASNAMGVDAAGNIYVAGFFNDTADLDPGPGVARLVAAGGTEVFLAKYDSAGNYIWAKSIGGTGNDNVQNMVLDDYGHLYITGGFNAKADFDPGSDTAYLAPVSANSDIYFAKYDTSGNYIWAKRIGGTLTKTGYALKAGKGDALFLGGVFTGTVNFNPAGTNNLVCNGSSGDGFYARYDTAGNYVWARSVSSSGSNTVYSIDADDEDNMYMTGFFQSAVNFNPGGTAISLTASGSDIFTARYDANGICRWAKKMGGTSTDAGRNIRLSKTGRHFYLHGYFNGTANLNPAGTANLATSGGQDVFIARYDTLGNYAWAKKMGGAGTDMPAWLDVDAADGVYLTGYFNSASFATGGGNLANKGSSNDIYLVRYDTLGSYDWALSAGNTSDDRGSAVAVTASGAICMAGLFTGTVDFDPGPDAAELVSSNNSFDVVLARYIPCKPAGIPALSSSPSGICPGGNATLSVSSGSLNAATDWVWHTGSCGGTAADTGASVSVSPLVTTTYYVRGEGGCAVPGMCDSITLVVGSAIVTPLTAGICPGDSVLLGGAWQKAAGTYYDTLQSSLGCDSVLETTLTINAPYTAPTAVYEWAKGIGGKLSDAPNAIRLDAGGNIYVAGFFNDTADLDPGPGVAELVADGSTDVFLAKYDPSGNLIWAKSIGGTGGDNVQTMELDAYGHLYITGGFNAKADFDPGGDTAYLTPVSANYDIYVAKYDTAGNYIWAKKISGSLLKNCYTLRPGKGNALYLGGQFTGTVNFDPAGTANLTASGANFDGFLAKYDTAGNHLWVRAVSSGGTNLVYTIDVDGQDNPYVSGSFQNTVNFNPGGAALNVASTSASVDIFAAHYDTAGICRWAKKMGGTLTDIGRTIRVNEAGGYFYLYGYFNGTANFNPAGTANLAAGGQDVFIARYDTLGNYAWAKKMGGTGAETPMALDMDADGSVYMTGFFASPTFATGGGNLVNSGGGNDAYLVRYDSSGSYNWAFSAGSAAGDDRGGTVAVNAAGAVFLGGNFAGTVDFDPGAGTDELVSVNGSIDGFIAKYTQYIPSDHPVFATQRDTICSGNSITLSVSGNLRSATGWQWYTGSCGATPVQSGASLSVTPPATVIYYVRGEGGCVTGPCDSFRVTVVPFFSKTQEARICQGDSLLAGGSWQKTPGTYYDTLHSVLGCDSIIATTLTVNPVYFVPLTAAVCQGDSLLLGGSWRKTAGTYYDTLHAVPGCDSVIATTLTIHPVYVVPQTAGICQGDSLLLGGSWQKAAGTYYDTLQSSFTCDSIIATTLSVHPVYTMPQTLHICDGDSILLGGSWRKAPGTYYDTLQSSFTCDSIIITTLSVDTVNVFVSADGMTLTSAAAGAAYQWLDCDNGYMPVSGATNRSYTALVERDYAVVVTVNGCSDTSDCYHAAPPAGIGEKGAAFHPAAYPNPAGDWLYIDLGAVCEQSAVQLQDMNGRRLISDTYRHTGVITLDMRGLPAAVYFVRLTAGDKQAVFKVTKK